MSIISYKNGIKAETLVCDFYTSRNYKIIATRFRCKSGEIDIIAKKDNLIAFIEVKSRKKLNHLDFITEGQKMRYFESADIFIEDYKAEDIRKFDRRFDFAIVENMKLKRIITNIWQE